MATRILGVLIAAAALAAAFPASAEPEAPVSLTEEGGFVRHAPTGIALPGSLGGIRRAANISGSPAVVIYAQPGSEDDPKRRFAVAIGQVAKPPAPERMRDLSRHQAAGGASLKTLVEGAFVWPGHPDAQTFRGSYVAGGLHKQYWHAWDAGYGVTVMVEWAGDEPGQMEKIEAAVAAQIFGGAPR